VAVRDRPSVLTWSRYHLGFPISTRDEVSGYRITIATDDISMAAGCQSPSLRPVHMTPWKLHGGVTA